MNHLTRAGKEALKQLSTRGFASGSELPSRKVAVLGAAVRVLGAIDDDVTLCMGTSA